MSTQTLTGVSSMATRHVLADLARAAEAAGLPALELTSMGGVTATEQVAAGEPFDLVVLDQDAIIRLGHDGYVDRSTVRPLVVSNVGIAVAAVDDETAPSVVDGDPSGPAFPDANALREALLAAEGIGYSTGPSGIAVLGMFRKLGIHDDVADRLVQARPGVPVTSLIADGEVSLGFQQMSELLGEDRVRVLGTLPPGLEIASTFSAAVATTSGNPAATLSVLEFWNSPGAGAIKTEHHFTSNGGSREY